MQQVEVAGDHLHLLTPEFEGLLDWYVDIFGLDQRPRGRIETTINVPGMNLSFGNAPEPMLATRGRSIDHIGCEPDDLEAFCTMLAERGIEFDLEYSELENLGLKIAFITDPSGVYIELTEGYDAY